MKINSGVNLLKSNLPIRTHVVTFANSRQFVIGFRLCAINILKIIYFGKFCRNQYLSGLFQDVSVHDQSYNCPPYKY